MSEKDIAAYIVKLVIRVSEFELYAHVRVMPSEIPEGVTPSEYADTVAGDFWSDMEEDEEKPGWFVYGDARVAAHSIEPVTEDELSLLSRLSVC